MDSPVNKCPAKQLHDQDSSSIQSTGQSQQVGGGGGSLDGSFSAHSGSNGAYLWQAKGKNQSVIAKVTPDIFFPLSQSMVCVPYPCADPYSGCYLPAVGPQYTIHQQIGFMTPSRVPLPPDFGENVPIYVNSKQYRGILRRRESRARLEARNRLVRDRKPYLHESRHLHALKRARGCGGRFLNTKNLQQSERTSTIDAQNELDSASVQSGSLSESEASKSETGNTATSVTSSCEVTLIDKENMNMFRPSNPWLSGYPPHMVIQDGGGGMVFNGSQLRVPAIQ